MICGAAKAGGIGDVAVNAVLVPRELLAGAEVFRGTLDTDAESVGPAFIKNEVLPGGRAKGEGGGRIALVGNHTNFFAEKLQHVVIVLSFTDPGPRLLCCGVEIAEEETPARGAAR